MKKLIDFFIDRSLLVNLITLMIIIVGGFSLWGIQKETFPQVDFDVILISTGYPGSSAEDVEKLVTISLERQLKSVDGIKELNSLSAEGRSIIYLEVEPDADIDEVLEDAKNAVDLADDLPDDATIPTVTSLTNKRRGIIKITLTDGKDYNHLRKVSKKLRDKLESLSEISLINLDGYRVDEIRIDMSPSKMRDHEVTIAQVANAVKNRNLNLSAGTLRTSEAELMIRTLAEFKTLDEIRNIVIHSNNSGHRVQLSEIATVKRGPTDGSVLQRSNGKEAIFLDVKARNSADVIGTTDKLKKIVEDFFANGNYAPVEYIYTDDLSYHVKRRLNILKDNGVMGLILVFVCLLFFLNFRTTVVTSIGAPLAFMVAFIVMELSGVSLNLISMFALILVLGMLVDDSIIVSEHFYQKLEDGMQPREAARLAAFETVKPVTATILTTIVAFGALFFMGGIMGKFLWSVPAVVIICLLASWFECFVLLPSHLADFCKLSKNAKRRNWYDKLMAHYGKMLSYFLNWPKLTIFIFSIILVISLGIAKTMKFELFPGDDVRIAFIQVKGPVGSSIEKTDIVMKKIEKIAITTLRKGESEQIRSQTGVLLGDHGAKKGHHYGSLILYLTPPDERERSTDEIIKAITKSSEQAVKGYTITVTKQKGGPPTGKALDIELSGDSMDELKAAAKKIEKIVAKQKGITSSEIDYEEGKEQIIVDVDDAEARRLGLTTRQIALELRRGFSGDVLTEIRESDEDIEVKLFMDENSRGNIETLKELFIINGQNRLIPLSRVVTLRKAPGAFVIRRLNRKRVISVSASIDKAVTTPIELAKSLKSDVKKVLESYPNIDYEFGGENKDTKESMIRLGKSAFIALSCIFIILVVMFSNLIGPLVIMSAIPLGFIGVIWTFFISGNSLGFMAMMGVVALVGVVVNDSIVLVSFINQKAAETDNLKEAVIKAAKSRFRPVILTTFTTVAGLLPIAHPIITKVLTFGKTVDSDPFLQPMAMSFAWGLLFASLVTLVFIPCGYIVAENSKNWIKLKFNFGERN